jgi:type VI secretion system protein ImpJ
MSSNNRVVWSEGLFLRPQHLQQLNRYIESTVEGRCAALRAHSWGFTELQLDRDHLKIGKLELVRAVGVFPDGTPFSMPDIDALPPALEPTGQVRDKEVYLAIPMRKEGARESDRSAVVDGLVRYLSRDEPMRDVTSESDTAQPVEVASLRARLLLAGQPRDDYVCIPVTRLIECRENKLVVIDEEFIPTVMNSQQARRLSSFITELQGLMHQRGEALARLAVGSARGGAAEISDFLLLQAINRYEPVVTHLAQSRHVHPEDLFRLCLEIVGDLSTLTLEGRRPPKLPVYEHERLKVSFEPLMAALRNVLNISITPTAQQLPLEKKRFNYWAAVVADQSLFDTAAFVLAVRADVPGESLRREFPTQSKAASADAIAVLVRDSLPGVPILPLAVAPRQIPYHAGYVYFELERNNSLFRDLKSGGRIALHVPDTFPGLAMEMWAIRG